MKPKALLALQIVMGTVCLFHVMMGLGLNVSSGFVGTAASWYGAEVAEWSPQFLYIIRPLGVFMLALGALAGMAALKPETQRVTVYVFAAIFIVRGLQRVIFGEEIASTFGIDGSRNLMNMAFFFGLAAVLIVLDLFAHRTSPAEEQPAAT